MDKIAKEPAIRGWQSTYMYKILNSANGMQNTLKEIGYLSTIENPDTLKMIIS